ncbi:hypothetical protein O9992_09640 [Vibrio lentus]|nr:hypothetical protein [Vibrio lentus]
MFEACKKKAIKQEQEAFSALDQAQQKTIGRRTGCDFELSGIGLPADEQHRYGEISKRQSELGSHLNNVLDATMGWSKQVTDVAELAGMPESALAASTSRGGS